MKYIFLLSLCLLLIACGVVEIATKEKYHKELDRFVGGKIERVVSEYGQADDVSESPNGNRLFIYTSSNTSTTPVTCTTDAQGKNNCVGGNTNHNWCKTYFEVNSKNLVLNYSLKGNNCTWCSNKNVLLCF